MNERTTGRRGARSWLSGRTRASATAAAALGEAGLLAAGALATGIWPAQAARYAAARTAGARADEGLRQATEPVRESGLVLQRRLRATPGAA
ncbi:MAG: hypothetical protein ACRDPO_37755, partial [Streptosporangiaceae bacterium]